MKFVDMEGKVTMPSTIRKDSDPTATCYICGEKTLYYDIKEKVYLCSIECRLKRCDLGHAEHIDTLLDG